MNITPKDVRTARRLLGLSQRTLAAQAGIGLATISRIEINAAIGRRGRPGAMAKLQTALEAAGVEFLEANGEPVVRLRKSQK